jgi:hypothetical protein
MSHFTRMIKSGEVVVRKDGSFFSGDTGGKDAGASDAAPQSVGPTISSHLQNMADRHENEGDIHSQVASHLQNLGLDKRAQEHRAVANEHKTAAAHYRAASGAAQDTSNGDVVAKHLKAARDSAGQAAELTKCMG